MKKIQYMGLCSISWETKVDLNLNFSVSTIHNSISGVHRDIGTNTPCIGAVFLKIEIYAILCNVHTIGQNLDCRERFVPIPLYGQRALHYT